MRERHTIESNNKSLNHSICQVIGLSYASDTLFKQVDFFKMEGFAMAYSIIEGTRAGKASELAGAAWREAHRAGFDIGKIEEITVTLKDGMPALVIKMFDLTNLAGQPEEREDA